MLDSTVTPEGPDALRPLELRRDEPDPRATSARPAAAAASRPNPVADVRKLVAPRHDPRPLRRRPRGRVRRDSLDRSSLFDMLEAGDLNPAWRSLLPAAFRSAALGDEAPLLRLASTHVRRAGKLQTTEHRRQRGAVPRHGVRGGRRSRGTAAPAPSRRAQQGADARRTRCRSSSVPPFDRTTVARSSLLPICFGWPNAVAAARAARRRCRACPTLLLAGEADFRTPLEDANAVAARLGATPVRRAAHRPLRPGQRLLGLRARRRRGFFRDGPTPACPPASSRVVQPVRPRAALAARGPAARAVQAAASGRTLNAVLGHASTTRSSWRSARELDGLDARRRRPRRDDHVSSARDPRCARLELVPGVRVTGTFPPNAATATLRITGRAAARGSLTIDARRAR